MAEPLTHRPEHGAHTSHVPRYVAVWVALLVFTFGTWGISRFHLPGVAGVAVALAIAIAKGGLVALFFMHLYDQPGPNRIVFATSLVFVALLVTLTLLDYATRFPLTNPPGTAGAVPALDYAPAPNDTTR
jgi:cytochrome c oxidase subunit 4